MIGQIAIFSRTPAYCFNQKAFLNIIPDYS